MNKPVLLPGLALLAALATAEAQTRYLQPVFDGVVAQADSTVYQTNYSFLPVLAGASRDEVPLPSYFQAYTPAGDTATDRPVMILHSTGSYLPRFVGGGILGTLRDSALVETASRFARLGYVAIVADYRQGWLPTASGEPENDDMRVGSLLIAAYKGIQDLRSLARYLRSTIADDGNPLGIDGDRIGMIGFGTGGYNTLNANFLDESTEVFDVPKYTSPTSGLPYLDTSRYGDPDGLDARPLNIPNNVGFDSRFGFAASVGGALGDTAWIDGNDDEAPTVSLHDPNDENAPFSVGDVFVPVDGDRLFIINAHGPRATVATANRLGVNDELDDVNAVLRMANDFATLRSDELADVAFTTRNDVATTLAVENLYTFVGDLSGIEANTYNYIDSATLSLFVAGYNAQTGDTTTTATYLARERATNPNITDPAAARLVIDTIMAFVAPRAFVALDLGSADDVAAVVDVADLDPADVGFRLYPNPVVERATIEVDGDVELRLLAIYDGAGRRVAASRMSGSAFAVERGNLPAGMYTLYVQTDAGALATQLVVR